jgi:hypothetical protein
MRNLLRPALRFVMRGLGSGSPAARSIRTECPGRDSARKLRSAKAKQGRANAERSESFVAMGDVSHRASEQTEDEHGLPPGLLKVTVQYAAERRGGDVGKLQPEIVFRIFEGAFLRPNSFCVEALQLGRKRRYNG